MLLYFDSLYIFFLLKFQFLELFLFKEVELDLPVKTHAVFYQDVSEVYQNADDYQANHRPAHHLSAKNVLNEICLTDQVAVNH